MAHARTNPTLLVVLLIGIVGAGCGGPAPSSPPVGATFDEFVREACAAFARLKDAIGEPGGNDSQLVDDLDEAFAAGDRDAAVRVGAAIDEELQEARRHAAAASGWEPGAEMMAELDRYLAAMQTQNDAVIERGRSDLALAKATFERAGGPAAWNAMLAAYQEVRAARPSGAPQRRCPGGPPSGF